MPRYRVSYEVEADDSDGAFDTAPPPDTRSAVTVTLLDEPEPEDDCEDGWPSDADAVIEQEEN
jgi:hypothetical protein